MKLKTILVAVFVAGLAVSVAVAAPAERGKGRDGSIAATGTTGGDTGTTTTGETGHKNKGKRKGHGRKAECRPNRAAVLVGDFVAAGDASFAMAVKGGNRVGKKLAGKQVTVSVGEGTKFRRSGKAALADLKAGDLLLVQGRACKLDAVALTLVAKKVVVLSPSDDEDDEDEDTDEGTTSTSTTGASTTGSTTTSSTSES
jgi:hypothetical protein